MNWNFYHQAPGSLHPCSAACIEREDGTIITYAQLMAMTGPFANYLASLGIGPGHRVVAKIEKSVEAVALYPATLRAGAAYLPLNTAYTSSETDYFFFATQILR